MAEGISVEVENGLARIEFLDKSKRGDGVAALLRAGGPGLIDVDTSGARKTYIVPENIAEDAGFIDAPKKTATKKATPAK